MEKWQYEEDEMLANPPEGKESRVICCECDEPINPDDKVYEIYGDCLCEKCAYEWLEQQAYLATYEECYGE